MRNKLASLLQKIERARIAYSRHQIVKLLAVSKYTDTQSIEALYACGHRAFGENKVQDLSSKKQELACLPLEWHFIGNLQSNKINSLLRSNPYLIHSISSLELALEVDKRCEREQRVLLQVQSSSLSKNGVDLESAPDIYREIQKKCQNLKLQGIMTMGVNSVNPREIEQAFGATKDVFDSLQKDGATILSMGMSGDYEMAIAHGANLVRIGSELFRTLAL